MPYEYETPLDIDNYRGGVSDNFKSSKSIFCEKAENFIISRIGQLKTRPGSAVYNADTNRVADGRTLKLAEFEDSIFVTIGTKTYKTTGSVAAAILAGPNAAQTTMFPNNTAASFIDYCITNGQLVLTADSGDGAAVVWLDGSTFKARTLGLPEITAPTVASSGGSGGNFIYYFNYYYTYTSGGRTYAVNGKTVQVTLLNAGAPNSNQVDISAIPVIPANSLYYDTANIKVKIWRTTDDGSLARAIGEVTNGTTTFTDTVSDATLATNLAFWREGGIVNTNVAPKFKYCCAAKGSLWAGNVTVGGSSFPDRILQSRPGDIDNVMESFSLDLGDNIVGMESYRDYPLIFCEFGVYRIEGNIDVLGGGDIAQRQIPGAAGCVSSNSIIKGANGIFYFARDGIYLTDGFTAEKVSGEYNKTYRNITSTATKRQRCYGAYDADTGRVYWAIQISTASSVVDNDSILCGHESLMFKGDNGEIVLPFTTWTNTADFEPTALVYDKSDLLRGTLSGFLLKHQTSSLNDTKESAAGVHGKARAIAYEYRSAALTFGSRGLMKYISHLILISDNVESQTNAYIQLAVKDHKAKNWSDLTPIKFEGYGVWGDAVIVWGDEGQVWGGVDDLVEARHVPRGKGKTRIMQFRVKNADIVFYEGSCTVAGASVTKPSNWPDDSEDYYISFDGGTTKYLIDAVAGTILTLAEAASEAGAQEYEISGVKKSQRINLVSVALKYAVLKDERDRFRA